MNGLEYLKMLCGGGGNTFQEDVAGNVWFDTDGCYAGDGAALMFFLERLREWLVPLEQWGQYCLLKDGVDFLKGYEIVIDEGMEGECFTRRPYYRIRGKSVSREQARDLVRRTDRYSFELKDIVRDHPDYLGSLNFDNWLIEPNHYPQGYGWVHADGTIGADAITQRYPEFHELITEWLVNLMEFPYLDLMIAMTGFNETLLDEDGEEIAETDYVRADEAFYGGIQAGICISGKRVEFLNRERAAERYQEYASLYENSNREQYLSGYYQDHGICQFTQEDIDEFVKSFQE